MSLKIVVLIATTLYQAIACSIEDRQQPPGQLFDVGGYRLHLYRVQKSQPTIVLEHSLGGSEGYFLVEALAELASVCIYDRAGYGWSDRSPHRRTSEQIVTELDTLLTQAGVAPPYILIGNSFGSYNVRLYAARFPEKVIGMVLTDALHETGMLNMPLQLKALWLFFVSGFVMSTLGSMLGIIRVLRGLRVFEILKPNLVRFSQDSLKAVKRSFCRSKHWITMSREMLHLRASARQLEVAQNFHTLPIVSIKADSFFKPSFWTNFIPLKSANRLREQMHLDLLKLSSNCVQLQARESGHFVWIDRPDVIVDAVKIVLDKIDPAHLSYPEKEL